MLGVERHCAWFHGKAGGSVALGYLLASEGVRCELDLHRLCTMRERCKILVEVCTVGGVFVWLWRRGGSVGWRLARLVVVLMFHGVGQSPWLHLS